MHLEELKEKEGYQEEHFYEGILTHEKLHEFISTCEQIMDKRKAGDIAHRNAYHILIEFLQNICKYSAFHEHEEDILTGYGAMFFGANEDTYTIITGNKVRPRDKQRIEQLINTVNELSKPELKKMYIEQLKNSEFNEKQGAGLGFISIKKKNKQPIDYQIIELGDDQFYYLVKTIVIDKMPGVKF